MKKVIIAGAAALALTTTFAGGVTFAWINPFGQAEDQIHADLANFERTHNVFSATIPYRNQKASQLQKAGEAYFKAKFDQEVQAEKHKIDLNYAVQLKHVKTYIDKQMK